MQVQLGPHDPGIGWCLTKWHIEMLSAKLMSAHHKEKHLDFGVTSCHPLQIHTPCKMALTCSCLILSPQLPKQAELSIMNQVFTDPASHKSEHTEQEELSIKQECYVWNETGVGLEGTCTKSTPRASHPTTAASPFPTRRSSGQVVSARTTWLCFVLNMHKPHEDGQL